MTKFDSVADKYGCDKGASGGHFYGRHYEELAFPYLLTRRVSTGELLTPDPVILEVGVHNGASLRLWEELFPTAKIFGIDIDPRCKAFESDRSRVFIGSQSDVAFIETTLATIGREIHLYVDDGSHSKDDILTTLRIVWPLIARDGVVAIEDIWYEFVGDIEKAMQELPRAVYVLRPSGHPNRFIGFCRKVP